MGNGESNSEKRSDPKDVKAGSLRESNDSGDFSASFSSDSNSNLQNAVPTRNNSSSAEASSLHNVSLLAAAEIAKSSQPFVPAFPFPATVTNTILNSLPTSDSTAVTDLTNISQTQQISSGLASDTSSSERDSIPVGRWASMTDTMSNDRLSTILSSKDENGLNDQLVGASRDVLKRLSENRAAVESFRSEVDNYLTHFGIDKTFITAREEDDESLKYSATSPDAIDGVYDKITRKLAAVATKPYASSYISDDLVARLAASSVTALATATEAKTNQRPAPLDLTDEQIASIPLNSEGKPTSIGSILHDAGQCRPCAFSNNPKKNGCSNGTSCTFCHFEHPKRKKPPRPSKHQRILKKLMEQAELESNSIMGKARPSEAFRSSSIMVPLDLSEFKTGSFEFPVYPVGSSFPWHTKSLNDPNNSDIAAKSLLRLIKGDSQHSNIGGARSDAPRDSLRTGSSRSRESSVTDVLRSHHSVDASSIRAPLASSGSDWGVDSQQSSILYVLAGGATGYAPVVYPQGIPSVQQTASVMKQVHGVLPWPPASGIPPPPPIDSLLTIPPPPLTATLPVVERQKKKAFSHKKKLKKKNKVSSEITDGVKDITRGNVEQTHTKTSGKTDDLQGKKN